MLKIFRISKNTVISPKDWVRMSQRIRPARNNIQSQSVATRSPKMLITAPPRNSPSFEEIDHPVAQDIVTKSNTEHNRGPPDELELIASLKETRRELKKLDDYYDLKSREFLKIIKHKKKEL